MWRNGKSRSKDSQKLASIYTWSWACVPFSQCTLPAPTTHYPKSKGKGSRGFSRGLHCATLGSKKTTPHSRFTQHGQRRMEQKRASMASPCGSQAQNAPHPHLCMVSMVKLRSCLMSIATATSLPRLPPVAPAFLTSVSGSAATLRSLNAQGAICLFQLFVLHILRLEGLGWTDGIAQFIVYGEFFVAGASCGGVQL